MVRAARGSRFKGCLIGFHGLVKNLRSNFLNLLGFPAGSRRPSSQNGCLGTLAMTALLTLA